MAKKCKILLVDDEKDVVNLLEKGLELNGFEVDAYTEPKDALFNFKAGVHDLLLFDIRMPGMTGIQLYKEIKDIDKNVRVLFLTAFEIHEKEWHMVLPHTEAKGFIKKPVTIEYLVNAIKRTKTQTTH